MQGDYVTCSCLHKTSFNQVDYYKKLFKTAGNIIELIEKDDIPKYLLFLENVFPYMDNYNYQKGMKAIIQELKNFLLLFLA